MILETRPSDLKHVPLKARCDVHISSDLMALIFPKLYIGNDPLQARRIKSEEIVVKSSGPSGIGQAVLASLAISESAISCPDQYQAAETPSKAAMRKVSVDSWDELKEKFCHLSVSQMQNNTFGVTKWSPHKSRSGGYDGLYTRYIIASDMDGPASFGSDIIEISLL